MSSTERAPEPTMEEILASIRRIITDDETGQARAPKPAQQAQQDDENLEGEGEADNQIIDDIARVLSAGAPAAPVDEEEEILDLTAELGGLELVEDDEVFEAAPSEPEFVMEAPAPTPPMPPAQDMTPQDMTPQDMTPQDMTPPQMEMGAPQPPAPPQPQAPAQAPAPQPSASQEAASALERAIAALRAGQVPTSTTPQAEPFQFQAAPQPQTMPTPETMAMPEPHSEPEPMAIPMAAPEPQAETYPDQPDASIEAEPEPSFEAQPDAAPTLELMGEPEAELALTEFEMTMLTETEEVVEFEAEPEVEFEAEPEVEPEAETVPFWASEAPTWEAGEPEPEYEPEPVAAQANGAGAHGLEGASKTLEDSVKDMLRPMLRQWLDENMPRMVTAALKDELGTDPMGGRRD